MKKFLMIGAATAALAACQAAPQAYGPAGPAGSQAPQVPAGVEVTGNVALTTDYRFRGITQTDDGPAIQGGLDVAKGSLYAGAWGSNTKLGVGDSVELDAYAGYAPTWRGVDWDAGVIYYAYPGADDDGFELDYVELYGGAAKAFGPLTVKGKAYYSPEYTGETGETVYATVGAEYAINSWVSVDANAGLTEFLDSDIGADDYNDFNVGVTAQAYGLEWDLRGVAATGLRDGVVDQEETVVASLRRAF